jgi:hypothetical protein
MTLGSELNRINDLILASSLASFCILFHDTSVVTHQYTDCTLQKRGNKVYYLLWFFLTRVWTIENNIN